MTPTDSDLEAAEEHANPAGIIPLMTPAQTDIFVTETRRISFLAGIEHKQRSMMLSEDERLFVENVRHHMEKIDCDQIELVRIIDRLSGGK